MVICEPICSGKQHLPFNTIMINNLVRSHNNSVALLCSKAHWIELKQSLDPLTVEKINYVPINTISRHDNFSASVASFKLLLSVKKFAKNKQRVVFLSSTSGIIDFSPLVLASSIVHCVVHMVLSRIDRYQPRNLLSKYFTLRQVLTRFKTSNTKIVVLEEVIKRNLLYVFPHLLKATVLLPHPVFGEIVKSKLITHQPKNICFPGTFNKEKGATDFLKLAKKMSQHDNYTFNVAGRLGDGVEIVDNSIFSSAPSEKFLSREEFVRLINTSDYLFLGHHPRTYKWCASGVYIDALSLETPIIARRSQFFEQQFELYGDMGILFDDISEVFHYLRHEIDNEAYEKYRENVKSAKALRLKAFDTSLSEMLK